MKLSAWSRWLKHKEASKKQWRRSPRRVSARLEFECLEQRCLLDAALNQAFVGQVYRDLLGREAEPDGLTYWTGLMDQGVNRPQVALAIENSPESLAKVVNDLYTKDLGRPADPVGLEASLKYLGGAGAVEQLEPLILGSPEYFAKHGGNAAGFVAGLYQDMLGRPPGDLGTIAIDDLSQAARISLAEAIAKSPEAAGHRVQGLYQRLLHRAGEDAGLRFWQNLLAQGTSSEQVIAAFISSEEYLNLAQSVTLPPPETALPPAVTVSLARRSALPDEAQDVSWQVTSVAANLETLIQLRQPGNVYPVGGSLDVRPGSLPATGDVVYLKPDGTLSADHTVYATGQTSGHTSFHLPAGAKEGEWQVVILYRDPGTGQFVSADASDFLVSSKPAMFLHVNRTLANTTDTIHAELLTSAGATPQDSTVVATLTLPDGRDVSLPGFGPSSDMVYQGPSSDAQYTLLAQPLGQFGSGVYHLTVRLLDGSGQHFLAMADADFTVSDVPGTLSGHVLDAAGQPVDGSSAFSANVEAFDIDDGSVSAQAAIGADGSYRLSLDPGRYLVSATILDTQGRAYQADGGIAVISSNGSQVALDVTATGSVSNFTAGSALPSVVPAGDTPTTRIATRPRAALRAAAKSLPPPTVFVTVTLPADLDPDGSLATRASAAAGAELRGGDPGLKVNTQAEVQHLADELAKAQRNNTDTLEMAQAFQRANGGEFVFAYSAAKLGNKYVLTRIVLNVTENSPVERAQTTVTVNSPMELLNAIKGITADGGPYAPKLEDARVRPVVPHLTVTLDKEHIMRNGTIMATVQVLDADNKPSHKHLAVSLIDFRPDGLSEQREGTTDDNGVFFTPLDRLFNVGPAAGSGRILAKFVRPGEEFDSDPSAGGYYQVDGQSRLSLLAVKYELRGGDSQRPAQSAQVALILFGDEGQSTIPKAQVKLTATSGTLSDSVVTTDSSGEAHFTYTAGNTNGIARVTGTYEIPSTSGDPPARITSVVYFLVTGAVTENLNARAGSSGLRAASRLRAAAAETTPTVIDGNAAEIFADIQVGGDEVPALPLRFTLDGAGALDNAQGQTDEFGMGTVFYVPPADGSGTATITATTTVDGQDYTKSLDIAYQPAPVTVSVSPASAPLTPGKTLQFTATIDGSSNQQVTWTATGGTITSDGLYTAGNTPGSYTVTATSAADSSKTGQAGVQIQSIVGTWQGTEEVFTRDANGLKDAGGGAINLVFAQDLSSATVTISAPTPMAGVSQQFLTNLANVFSGTYMGSGTSGSFSSERNGTFFSANLASSGGITGGISYVSFGVEYYRVVFSAARS